MMREQSSCLRWLKNQWAHRLHHAEPATCIHPARYGGHQGRREGWQQTPGLGGRARAADALIARGNSG